jgi:hypothetical protein
MPRPLRTVPFVVALSLCAVGCSTLYRPVYSPGKSNYKKPPEKKDAAELLLTTPANGNPNPAPVPGAGALPGLPPADGAAPAAPGMLDAPPAIPGLPTP